MAQSRSLWFSLRVALFSLLRATTTSAATLHDGDIEEGTWQRAVEENTTAAYEVYLRDHPVGSHFREALERIVELSAISFTATVPTANADKAIWLAAEDRSWGKDAGGDHDRGIGPY